MLCAICTLSSLECTFEMIALLPTFYLASCIQCEHQKYHPCVTEVVPALPVQSYRERPGGHPKSRRSRSLSAYYN